MGKIIRYALHHHGVARCQAEAPLIVLSELPELPLSFCVTVLPFAEWSRDSKAAISSRCRSISTASETNALFAGHHRKGRSLGRHRLANRSG